MRRQRQAGFTIVELLIATTVFSLVLVVVMVGVMRFTKAYYKGVTASSTQNVARTTIDEITQAVQFSGSKVTDLPAAPADEPNAKLRSQGFCVGAMRYSYLPGWQLKNESNPAAYQNTHVFVRDKPNGGCSDNSGQTAQDLLNDDEPIQGTELLTTNMRAANVRLVAVSGDPNLFNMTLRIIYGDADLLTSVKSPASNGRGDPYNATADDATCKAATAGTEFCAVSELSTMIQRRVD